MSEGEAKVVEAKAAQRKQAKRATFAALRGKKRAQIEFSMAINQGEDPVTFLFRAPGAQEYNALIDKHPPLPAQRAQGANFNINTFAPALLARVCIEPVMDDSDWAEIWNDPNWSSGEVSDLYTMAVNLCMQGLDTTPIEAG